MPPQNHGMGWRAWGSSPFGTTTPTLSHTHTRARVRPGETEGGSCCGRGEWTFISSFFLSSDMSTITFSRFLPLSLNFRSLFRYVWHRNLLHPLCCALGCLRPAFLSSVLRHRHTHTLAHTCPPALYACRKGRRDVLWQHLSHS